MLRNFSAAVFTLMSLFVYCLPAAGQQLLEDIRFESITPNEERIVLRLNSPITPKVFALKDGSPRMVFDFNGTGVSKRIKNTLSTGGKLIERVRVGIHDSTARVVLDMVPGRRVKNLHELDTARNILTIIIHDASVQPEPRKNIAVVRPAEKIPPAHLVEEKKLPVAVPLLQKPPSSSSAPVTAPPRPSGMSSAPTVLSSVIFDKNSNRGEMVMFRLNTFHPPVVFGLEEKKPRVICDFQETAAGERLPESVSADGKHVRGIRIERDEAARKIRVVLDLAPNNSYDLQQVFFKNDNLFVLIINTLGNPAKRLN